MDSGRRHEIPRSETRDLIIQGAANSISLISLSLPLAPDLMGGVMQMGPGGCLQMQWLVLQVRNLELKEPKIFNRQLFAYSFLWREILLLY